MSGGGGGGGGGGDYGPAPCEALVFDAQLTSPQAAVIATINVGDVLDVDLASMKGLTVVQVLKAKQVAGGLTGPDASRLRVCIEQGHKFTAEVLNTNGGQVRVRVEHA